MRRALASWLVLTVGFAVVCAAVGLALLQLQHRLEISARTQVLDTAKIVAALVVDRNLDAVDLRRGTLTVGQRAIMNADVALMLRRDRVIGLEVWHVDGQLIYGDNRHPDLQTILPMAQLQRARLGVPWVQTTASKGRGVGTLDVFLPRRQGTKVLGVVKVLLPDSGVTAQLQRSSRQLNTAAAAILSLVAAGLLLMRRRLLAREHQAHHDALTGLLNRPGLAEEMPRIVASASGEHGRVAALLMLDLDGFKAVNDTLGHPAGDALLTQVGQALRNSVRPSDRVVRLGGDEFAILLSGLPNAAKAHGAAQQLLDRLREGAYAVDGIELSVDASVGIALIPAHGQDADLLLQRADVAMYQAKRAGSGVTVYDEANDPYDVSQLGLLVELRRGITAGELVLHYQPKADMMSRSLTGVEALVRWQHPTRGLLPPAAFIGLAEHTGLMQPLTDWVLRTAVHQAAEWRDAGLLVPVSVNISPRSLLHGDLPATVLQLLADRALPADLLEIEITETAIMTDPDRAVQVLRRLHAMGARVSIDDFGTGYTSLSYLKKLPVQTLKIDQSFICNMLEDPDDEAITESVIALGHKLGLSVLAEGVETEQVWRRLQALDCDAAQGYHLARPMPGGEIAVWLGEHGQRCAPHACGPTPTASTNQLPSRQAWSKSASGRAFRLERL